MIPIVTVNLVSVIAAAIAAFVVGMIWYSPAVFGKKWMKMMGVTEKEMAKGKEKMMGVMATSLVLSVVTAYVLSMVMKIAGANILMDAVQLAFWIWLGFFAAPLYMSVLYEKKSMDWWIITAGHHLAGLLAMGIVLVFMR